MKTHSIALFLVMVILTLPVLADRQLKVPVMPDEAMVLSDAALFFQNPHGFEDRAELGNYLEAQFPIGTTEEAIKWKISSLITALHPTPRMHVSVSIRPNRLVIGFSRAFKTSETGHCGITLLNTTFLFDKDHRLSRAPIEMIDDYTNQMAPEEDIEPNSPNQAAEPTRTTGTPPASAGDRASGARGSP